MKFPRLLAGPIALAMLFLLPGVPVLADTSIEGPRGVEEISDLSRVTRVAEALRSDPLYLSHLVPMRPVDEEELSDMSAEVAGAFDGEVPLYVVMYASVPTDETGGRPTLFLHALHEVSGADGVYVAVTTDGRSATAAFDSPITPVLDEEGLGPGARPAVTLSNVLAMLEESPRTPVEATPLTSDAAPTVEQQTREPMSDAARFWDLAFPGGVLGLLVAGIYLRWSMTESSPRPRAAVASVEVPRHVRRWFAATARGSRWRFRRRLARELRLLRREFEAAPAEHAGLPRAREAYDAAGLIASSHGLPVTALVCGMVLARHGRRALVAPDRGETLPCRVNPLHDPASRPRSFYLGGRRRTWPVCARCRNADVRESEAMVLRHNRRPHFIHDIDDPWARIALAKQEPFARARALIGV
ncbi:hypothetical protein [Nocardiopsis sp. NPDC006832]|uniref:hypothetical protein n=1 Tax=Nocardiopsis sp. NPDC006832 TaxID=3157188 RepID=UPI0033D85C8B